MKIGRSSQAPAIRAEVGNSVAVNDLAKPLAVKARVVTKGTSPEQKAVTKSTKAAIAPSVQAASTAALKPLLALNVDPETGHAYTFMKFSKGEVDNFKLRERLGNFGRLVYFIVVDNKNGWALAVFKTYSGYASAKAATPLVIGNVSVHIVNRDRPIDNVKKSLKAALSQFSVASADSCLCIESPPPSPAAINTQVEVSAISSTPEDPKLNQSVPHPSPDSGTGTSTDQGLNWKRSHLLSALKALKIPHHPKASLGELRRVYDDHNDRREERNNPQSTPSNIPTRPGGHRDSSMSISSQRGVAGRNPGTPPIQPDAINPFLSATTNPSRRPSQVERSLTLQHVSETSAAMPDPAASNSRSSAPIGAPSGPRMMTTTSPFRPLNRNECPTPLRPQNSSLRPPAAQSNSSQRKQPVPDHQQAQGERLIVRNNQSKPPSPHLTTDRRDAISGPPGPSIKAHDKVMQYTSNTVAPGPQTIRIVGPCNSHTKAGASPNPIPPITNTTTSNTPLLAENAETNRQHAMDVWSLQQLEKHFANPPRKLSVPGPSVEVPNKAMEPASATVPSGPRTTGVVDQSSSQTNTGASSAGTPVNSKASTNSTQALLMPSSSQMAMARSGAISGTPGCSVETRGNDMPITGVTVASVPSTTQAVKTHGDAMLNTGTAVASVAPTTQAVGEYSSLNNAAAPSIITPLYTKAPITHAQATPNTSLNTPDEKSSHTNTAAPSLSVPSTTKASTTPYPAFKSTSLLPSSINPATIMVRDFTRPIFPEDSPPAGPSSTTNTTSTRPKVQQEICGPDCLCHNLFPDCLFPDEPCDCKHCTGEAAREKQKAAIAKSTNTPGTSQPATTTQDQSATEAPVPLWRRNMGISPSVRIATPDGKKIKEFGKDGPIWRKESK